MIGLVLETNRPGWPMAAESGLPGSSVETGSLASLSPARIRLKGEFVRVFLRFAKKKHNITHDYIIVSAIS